MWRKTGGRTNSFILMIENNCQSKCITSERFYNADVVSGN